MRLIYVDPPFGTGSVRRVRERRTGVQSTFDDRWPTMADYLRWLRSVLEPAIATLADDGAIFVHCDSHASHHIRVLLDELLGPENFRNEVIWHYRRWTRAKSSLQRLHQTIYYYARTSAHKPNVPLVAYSPTTNLDQIWQARARNELNVSVYAEANGGPRNSGAKRGVPMGDVWEIPPLNPKARERVGYPTQKPLALLERILELGTAQGDLVLDPCCGSGTTLVAAKLLGRSAIGIDVSPRAVELTQARLASPVRSESKVLDGREAFQRRWASPEYLDTLELLSAHGVQRNRYIHGYLSPIGLTNLGFPSDWSVPVALVDVEAEALDHWLKAVAAIAEKKSAHAALVLTKMDLAASQGRIIAAPWPSTATEVEEVRRRVELWLRPEACPESA